MVEVRFNAEGKDYYDIEQAALDRLEEFYPGVIWSLEVYAAPGVQVFGGATLGWGAEIVARAPTEGAK
jgi:hypothetical protein